MGLVLLECLTGTLAYPGPPLPAALARLMHARDLPAGLDPQWTRLLKAMTATDPVARPTASETALALRECVAPGKRRRRARPGRGVVRIGHRAPGPWIIEDAVDMRAL